MRRSVWQEYANGGAGFGTLCSGKHDVPCTVIPCPDEVACNRVDSVADDPFVFEKNGGHNQGVEPELGDLVARAAQAFLYDEDVDAAIEEVRGAGEGE